MDSIRPSLRLDLNSFFNGIQAGTLVDVVFGKKRKTRKMKKKKDKRGVIVNKESGCPFLVPCDHHWHVRSHFTLYDDTAFRMAPCSVPCILELLFYRLAHGSKYNDNNNYLPTMCSKLCTCPRVADNTCFGLHRSCMDESSRGMKAKQH